MTCLCPLTAREQLSGTTSTTGTRDIHFVHAYIVYQLLARRVQRDLLLMSALLHQLPTAQKSHSSASTASPGSKSARKAPVDARLFPAVVKLLDSVLQSLEQMRALPIVDDSPDLAAAADARLAYTKARRCLALAQCYAPLKRHAEALALSQHAALHLRECRALLAPLLDAQDEQCEGDAINAGAPAFYALAGADLARLEAEVEQDATGFKNDWFAHSGGGPAPKGGAAEQQQQQHKKPLFFDIALNYISLDMDRLQERAGKTPEKPAAPAVQQAAQVQAQAAEKKTQAAKAKVEEIERAATPEPAQARGLGGLLGGWWGRR